MAINKEDYLYISSLLRAREPRMLSREKAERMLDASSVQDAAKMLTDSGYEDMSEFSVKEIENALSEKRSAVFHELETLVPNPAVLDLFRLKYDYHNAKVLIKSEAVHRNDEKLLSGSGRITPELMQKRFSEDRLKDLPGELGRAAEEAKGLLNRSANPQLSDFLLDKAYFREMAGLADELDSDFARGYVGILADSTNLRSVVRILRMGKDIGYLQEALVSGGSVSGNLRELLGELYLSGESAQYDNWSIPAVTKLRGVTVAGVG